ncbi:hypothetical protein J6590_082936, partial [Homalodisca vitripennis]
MVIQLGENSKSSELVINTREYKVKDGITEDAMCEMVIQLEENSKSESSSLSDVEICYSTVHDE